MTYQEAQIAMSNKVPIFFVDKDGCQYTFKCITHCNRAKAELLDNSGRSKMVVALERIKPIGEINGGKDNLHSC